MSPIILFPSFVRCSFLSSWLCHLFYRTPGAGRNIIDARNKRPGPSANHEGFGRHEEGDKTIHQRLSLWHQMNFCFLLFSWLNLYLYLELMRSLDLCSWFTVQIEIGETCGAEGIGQIAFFVLRNII